MSAGLLKTDISGAPDAQLESSSPQSLLAIRDLHVAYKMVPALRGISLDVNAGGFVALLGANGAGKTTTLKAISGLVRLSGGSIEFDGRSMGRRSPWQSARARIGHVPEGRKIFPDHTVLENLQLGGWTIRSNDRLLEETLEGVLSLFPRLQERLEQQAGTLSGGEAQMLAVARALMLRPRLLMLDEPSLGLAPRLVAEMFEYLRRLHKEQGMTVLLVEQVASVALALADRCYVLENGHVALEGTSDELRNSEAVRRLYLGG